MVNRWQAPSTPISQNQGPGTGGAPVYPGPGQGGAPGGPWFPNQQGIDNPYQPPSLPGMGWQSGQAGGAPGGAPPTPSGSGSANHDWGMNPQVVPGLPPEYAPPNLYTGVRDTGGGYNPQGPHGTVTNPQPGITGGAGMGLGQMMNRLGSGGNPNPYRPQQGGAGMGGGGFPYDPMMGWRGRGGGGMGSYQPNTAGGMFQTRPTGSPLAPYFPGGEPQDKGGLNQPDPGAGPLNDQTYKILIEKARAGDESAMSQLVQMRGGNPGMMRPGQPGYSSNPNINYQQPI